MSSSSKSPEVVVAVKPDHLVWKPFVIHDGGWSAAEELRSVDGVHNLHGRRGAHLPRDPADLGCDTFLLSDLVIGESVLLGLRTNGDWSYGVVTGWEPGKFFRYDGPNMGSMLWNNILLLRGPSADAARAAHRPPAEGGAAAGGGAADTPPAAAFSPVPLKRTDSGSNYGFSGTPDFKTWMRLGAKPWFTVEAADYNGYFTDLRGKAAQWRLRAAQLGKLLTYPEGAFLPEERQAIKNQIEGLLSEAALAEAEVRSRSVSPAESV